MGDNICKTFFLKKSDNFSFDLDQIFIVRQLYERWASILECGKVSTNGDKCPLKCDTTYLPNKINSCLKGIDFLQEEITYFT